MPNVTIRDVPADVHAALVERARSQGQSLQQYLTVELAELAERPTLQELFERVLERGRGRVTFADALGDLEATRR